MEKNFIAENAVYQIYPISFKDSNGDGKGDLRGIISKLDYLQSLGIRIVWLSPIYASPMVDMGYDVADYRKINPMFGTMEDFDLLIAEAKKRDIRIVMDLVVNHTSDQNPWFQEALKDPDSKYRNYYVFMKGKGKDGKEYPNNWTSSFLGSAWTEVPNEKGMYYLHLFSKQQPDLNWHNPEVLKEVEDIIAFWMDKGVYGFRCDVIASIYKESYEDGKTGNPLATVGREHYTATQGCHEILKKIRKDVVEPHHGILIGECFGISTEQGQAFLDHELDTFFQFETATLDAKSKVIDRGINPKVFAEALRKWQTQVSWNGNYLENHDQRRSVGRYVKDGKYGLVGSKMLLTLLYTLRGTPFIYQGEEIGARNYPELIPMEETRDCVTRYIYDMMRHYHFPKKMSHRKALRNGRDNERAPMAFDGSDSYGFSQPGVTPWQMYNRAGKTYNVEAEEKDPNSTLSFFRKINQFRRETMELCYGDIRFLDSKKDVLCFTRTFEGKTVAVILNLTDRKRGFPKDLQGKEVLFSDVADPLKKKLQPYEADILRL
jgi:oligo-1,6-glucosidase